MLHNPTKIIFGKDTIKHIGAETAFYGNKALLVYGQHSVKKNGVLDQVKSSLSKAGCQIVEYSDIKPNPLLSQVHEGISKFITTQCDVIVAVGGGSVIDSAKAISAGVPVNHDVWKFFTAKKSIKSALPLVCVPTLAASGTDNNSGMVITHDAKQLKFGYGSKFLYPKVSILDPQTTYSVPSSHTAFGAVDIISHLLEFYFTTKLPSTPVQDRIIEGLLCSVIESCENALKNGEDYEARAALMWTASLALSGLTSAGLGRVEFPMHLLEHSLSALFNVAHGAGLAVIIPSWMSFRALSNPEKIAQLGERVFQINRNNVYDSAVETTSQLKNWFQKIGCPVTLGELGVAPEQHKAIADNTQPLAKIWRLRQYNTETVRAILNLCC